MKYFFSAWLLMMGFQNPALADATNVIEVHTVREYNRLIDEANEIESLHDYYKGSTSIAAADQRIPILIEYGAPWCTVCNFLKNVYQEVGSEFPTTLKIYLVDVDFSTRINGRWIPSVGDTNNPSSRYRRSESLPEIQFYSINRGRVFHDWDNEDGLPTADIYQHRIQEVENFLVRKPRTRY